MTTQLTNSIDNHNSQVIDPFKESINSLIVIAFPHSNSKNLPIVLSIAQGASTFGFTEIGNKKMYVAQFAKTQDDAGRASALLEYINNWKGTLLFSQGKILPFSYDQAQVINCFLDSCLCSDKKAHCYTIIDDPFIDPPQNHGFSLSIRLTERPSYKVEHKIDRYAFPCKQLYRRFRFERDHPSTPQSQIQAAGVGQSCNICPNFEPNAFRIVGTRSVFTEVFE